MQETYTADSPGLVGEERESAHGHLPFFYPNRLTESDLCYFATGLIRYDTSNVLLQHQAVFAGVPGCNWYDENIEYLMYIITGRISAPDDTSIGRTLIAMSGRPGYGADTLFGDSARYGYRMDASMGFTCSDCEMLHPLARMDIIGLVQGVSGCLGLDYFSYNNTHYWLPFQPRFFRERRSSDAAPADRRYEVKEGRWLDLVPVDGLFLPFLKKEETFDSDLERVQARLAQAGGFGPSTKLYLGTNTFTDPKRREQRFLRPMMTVESSQIEPLWCRLPRAPGSDKLRHSYLRNTVGAYGSHIWRRSL
jgi:hypothetical protein